MTLLGQRFRRLLRRPQVAVPAVVSLGLGSAGVVVMLAMISAVLVSPLPYPDSDELAFIGWRFSPTHTSQPAALTQAMAEHVAELATQFDSVALYTETGSTHALALEGLPAQRVTGVRADNALLPTTRVEPIVGRNFTAEESRAGASVVLVHQGLAERLFRHAHVAVGEDIELNGVRRQIIGVLPAEFRWHGHVDVVIPYGSGDDVFAGGHNTSVVGRVAPGASLGQAAAEADALLRAYMESRGVSAPNDAWGAWVIPYKDLIVGSTDEPLHLLLGAAGLLMLLACFSTANLVLADATASRGDAAVQLALGARARDLHLRRFIDCVLLAIAGLSLGALLAYVSLPVLVARGPTWMQYTLNDIGIDGWVVAWLVPTAIATALLCTALAALGSRVSNLAHTLRGTASGRGGERVPVRKILTITQIAASFVLLVGATLLGTSIQRLVSTDLGFDTDGIHVAQVSFADTRYRGEASSIETAATLTRLTERLERAPGVQAVAAASSLPLERGLNNYVRVAGHDDGLSVEVRIITPSYFAVLGVPILQGRDLDSAARADAEPVVVVNRAFVERVLPDAPPLDASLTIDGKNWRVIGIAADQRDISLRQSATPTVFMTYAQAAPELLAAVNQWFPSAVLARGSAPDFRAVIASEAPEVPLLRVRELSSVVAESVPLERFISGLLALFGALALTLSITGLFGLLEFERVRRRHELAVRVALGAQRRQVGWLVLRRGLAWVVAGLAIGAVISVPAVRAIERLLHQPGVGDLGILMVLAFGVLSIALAAAGISAGRAARVAPNAALRHE